MDEIKTVEGKNKGKIMLYALSTCVWCKKTKRLLDDLDVEYNYIFVDKLDGEKKEKIKEEIKKWNPKISFPTIVLNDKKCIVGYKKDEIKKALKE